MKINIANKIEVNLDKDDLDMLLTVMESFKPRYEEELDSYDKLCSKFFVEAKLLKDNK